MRAPRSAPSQNARPPVAPPEPEPTTVPLPEGPPLWVSRPAPDQAPRFSLHGRAEALVLASLGRPRGRIYIAPERLLLDEEDGSGSLRPVLEGLGTALWYEQQGVPVLHANVLALPRHPGDAPQSGPRRPREPAAALALLGPSGAGKSTLTAFLLGLGARLVSDEGLPLLEDASGRFCARPGRGRIRLFPDVGAPLYPHFPAWDPVVPGAMKRIRRLDPALCVDPAEPWPVLRAIVVLDRRVDPPTARPVTTELGERAALTEILAASLAGTALSALGWEARRLPRIAALLRRVPVLQLTYPSGLTHGRQVASRLLQAVAALAT